MNEITRIHLGRQPFTISVEAQKALRDYLAAIEAEVGDKEVVEEVELRMAELLGERGISGDKVILPADVDYLKQQLGDPADFAGGEDEAAAAHGTTAVDNKTAKRLFRDPDSAMIAGVSAGLGSYFGIDVVIIRIIFILLTFFGGGIGILLYFVFWILVPPAETTSEKLQMQGKPVTLEALKESVNRADVPGAARRMSNQVSPVINRLLRIIIKIIGGGFILAGICIVIGIAALAVYLLLHHGQLFQENLFPVGLREMWLLDLGMLLAAIAALFLLLVGVAAFRRRWPVSGWITALLAGVFVIATIGSAVLAADTAPHVHQRYEASLHTTAIKGITPFNKVVSSGDVDIVYVSSPDYAVNVHYSDNPDLSKLKIHVDKGTLYIDSSALDRADHCTMLCLFPRYNMTVQVYAPNVRQFVTPPRTEITYPPVPSVE